ELHTPGTGDDFLEDYIEHYPTDSELPAVFAKLDQLYAAERRQSRHEFGKWMRDSAQPRRALAQMYLARAELRLGQRDDARETLQRLLADHPPLPALAEAFLQLAAMEMQADRAEEVPRILEAARALRPPPAVLDRINFMAARAEYSSHQYRPAAATFRTIARNGSLSSQVALFDESLAWLAADDRAQATASAQELAAKGGSEEARGDLALEQGLAEAAHGEKSATQSLQNFLRSFPKHPRASEAWVALAELAFHAAPPRLDEARQNLTHASENQLTPVAAERADYLRIWLEDAAGNNDERALESATQFLQKYPNSPLLGEVRLKLAETFYRRQDFASAQTQFELLAQANPKSPLAEKAQFFAAESAMRSMGKAALDRALVLFDEVVKRDGEMKWAARNEQAVIERKLGKPDDAMTLYDEVLKGDAKPAEKREALCGKGDIFYELGATKPENYQHAIEIYDQLASDHDASPHWHNQALFKKGMCQEKLNAPADALATFYGIIEDESRPERRREFFWFYKAGFNAARLLEEASKWQPAAAIYEKLAFAGGPRSEEAKSRLNHLRLEHFLWEQ
ncbi:MAG: tetratricopeptide repeat protein, partial [Verrucomicrobiota bacterium]|nr:tetratricopeptide repeat protein [Verrucomicrobiota bacterium]